MKISGLRYFGVRHINKCQVRKARKKNFFYILISFGHYICASKFNYVNTAPPIEFHVFHELIINHFEVFIYLIWSLFSKKHESIIVLHTNKPQKFSSEISVLGIAKIVAFFFKIMVRWLKGRSKRHLTASGHTRTTNRLFVLTCFLIQAFRNLINSWG